MRKHYFTSVSATFVLNVTNECSKFNVKLLVTCFVFKVWMLRRFLNHGIVIIEIAYNLRRNTCKCERRLLRYEGKWKKKPRSIACKMEIFVALPIAKHSGLKEISSIATSPFEENPLDASNCKKYLEIHAKEVQFSVARRCQRGSACALPVSYIGQRNHLPEPDVGAELVPVRPPQSVGVIPVWLHLDQVKSQRSGVCAVLVVEKPYLKAFFFFFFFISPIKHSYGHTAGLIGQSGNVQAKLRQRKCVLDTSDSKDSWDHCCKVASDCTKGSRWCLGCRNGRSRRTRFSSPCSRTRKSLPTTVDDNLSFRRSQPLNSLRSIQQSSYLSRYGRCDRNWVRFSRTAWARY